MNNQQLASDSFASGALASGWAPISGLSESQIVGSSPYFAEPVALSTTYGQQWTGTTWPVDQACEVTVQTLTSESGTVLNLNVRMQSGSYSGYQCEITNGTVVVSAITNGTPTQIGSTVTGLTFASGDVWSFQAAGACLTVFHNWVMIFWGYDVTYTGGSPGFSQSSTVNIAHTQVASFRGYSTVQQDGVWQRQGILIAPIASEVGGNVQGHQNPWILVEGNAQILSGTGNVFKMWFIAAHSGSAASISYAESYTGLPGTFVRYSGNPIFTTAGVAVAVWEHGGTYYLFAQTTFTEVSLWTSSNGVTGWTSQGQILATGTGGAWDSYAITYFSPIYFDGTTLYATYCGWSNSGPSTGGVNTGLATAVYPFTSWTKSASNPVISNVWGLTIPYVSGGTFWFWGQSNNVGRGYAPANGIDPVNGIRISTTYPFTTWSTPIISMHPAQQYQGLNANSGGCYVSFALGVGNQTYLYVDNSTADSVADEGYQIDMAIAPIPISQLVTMAREDGTSQLASDGFTSGTGNLSSNWSVVTGVSRLAIASGDLCEASASNTNCAQLYNAVTCTANQYSEVTLYNLSGAYVIPAVRMQASGLNFYGATATGTIGTSGTVYINKTVGGTATHIGPTISFKPLVGDVIRLIATDSGYGYVNISVYQNGYLLSQVQDYSNSFTSGSPGLQVYANSPANAQISNWAGGNAGIIPVYSGGGGGGDSLTQEQLAVLSTMLGRRRKIRDGVTVPGFRARSRRR